MAEGSEDLEEDLREEGEPIEESSPDLQSPGRVNDVALAQLRRHSRPVRLGC